MNCLRWLVYAAALVLSPALWSAEAVQADLKEQVWLRQGHEVRIRLSCQEPLTICRDGEAPRGIVIDLLVDLLRKHGIRYRFTPPSSLPEDEARLQQGVGPDVLPNYVKTEARQAIAVFTRPHFVTPYGLFVREGSPIVVGLDDLAGRRVAVDKGFSVGQSLLARYPSLQLVEETTTVAALDAVASGKADAYVGNLVAARYAIEFSGRSKLLLAAPVDLPPQQAVFGVRKDWPELASLLDRELAALSEQEKQAYLLRYLPRTFDRHFSFADFVLWAGGVALLALLVVAVVNRRALRRVRRQVVAKEEALEALRCSQQQLELQTARLADISGRLDLSLRGGQLGTWRWNLESGEVDYDERWAAILGYMPGEVSPNMEVIQSLVNPDDVEEVFAAIAECQSGATDLFRVEFRMQAKDGKYRWIQSSGMVAERSAVGKVVSMVGVNQDVSERKHAEARLEKMNRENQRILNHLNEELASQVLARTDELEAANASLRKALAEVSSAQAKIVEAEKLTALGRMVASFAHDVASPISNSRVVADTLREQTAALLLALKNKTARQSDVQRYVETVAEAEQIIESSLSRAFELLEGFKQTAIDQATMQRREIELKPWLEQLAISLSPLFKKTPHRLVLEVPGGIVLDILPGALGRALDNLVANALLHGFAGQPAGLVRLVAQDLGDTVELRISDNGCGMTPEVQAKMFDAFFTTRAGSGGTGLGLFVVREMVEKQLCGTITAHCEEGGGMCFVLNLPKRCTAAPLG